ncbi:hypothetical protein PL11_001830 [Lentilactobacillus curieae]|uniref:Uncharacterized protein n=1 Tax=Lentilactobacillus curieae TaxID=1138822 RepID=A0A1S6QGK6_9LACO|nr:hypothetical protein [Lentilactobacillus curieae]AQW20743.1 hypothetical protein PL11_001830 [Lentilactobacillus curieae]
MKLGTNNQLFVQIYDFTLNISRTAAYAGDAHSVHFQVDDNPIALTDMIKDKIINYSLVECCDEHKDFDSHIHILDDNQTAEFNSVKTNARMKFVTTTYTMWHDPQIERIYFQQANGTKGYFAGDALLLRDIIYLESVGVPFLDR